MLAMLVFEDNVVLMTEKAKDLRMMKVFFSVCLRVNLAKSRVMICKGEDRMVCNTEI